MSKKSKGGFSVAADGGTTSPTPAPGPTTTAYQQLANDVVKALDAAEASLPPLEARHPATFDFVRSHLNVPLEKLAVVVSHVEQRGDIQSFGTLDPQRGRQFLQLAESYPAIAERARRFAEKVEYTARAVIAELTADCQQTSAVVQALARNPESGDLPVVSRSMKQALGRPPRRKKDAPPPATAAAA